MVANLETLFEAVDQTRIDRRLADAIEADLDRINTEIAQQGFGLVVLDGKTFRIVRAANDVAGAA